MSRHVFYPANDSPVLRAAGEILKSKGYGVVRHPCEGVTDLLLPVPSFDADGKLKDGGDLGELLKELPKSITIIGGNLPGIAGYKTIDLLQDTMYLADNAAITAYCALRLAMKQLPTTLRGLQVLIIGWGRIGKCLAALLWGLEAEVTVAARKAEDRAMAHALGYHCTVPDQLGHDLNGFRLIYNTAPAPVLSLEQISHCRDNCLMIDLASCKGIEGEDVIWARGLPGKDTPEASGRLIAKTAIRLIGKKEERI